MSRALSHAVAGMAHLEAAPAPELNGYLVARLQALMEHAGRHSELYRQRFATAGWQSGQALTANIWQRIAPLPRAELQERADELVSEFVPDDCGRTVWILTSGSTGRPVRVSGTSQQAGLWRAITVREHIEHRRDFGGRLAVIKVTDGALGRAPEGSDFPDWGAPVNQIHSTGPAAVLSIEASSDEQARWLATRNPHYLLTYPSNLDALIDAVDAGALALPALRQARTIGEVVSDELRERCARLLNVPLVDTYSSAEVGYIATQVPLSTRYRCRNETVLVELLDDDGNACAPGELGRVVVSALYSFAMPLLRYDIGDFAIGLDTELWAGAPRYLQRIIGRARNLLRLPDGSRRWPRLGLQKMMKIAPLRQIQTVQSALHRLELKVVCARPLSDSQRGELAAHLRRRFTSIEEVHIEEVAAIARESGRKYEEFRCEI